MSVRLFAGCISVSLPSRQDEFTRFRIYTTKRDGKKSINDVWREEFVAANPQEESEAAQTNNDGEFFREYRALLAEDEPWKEEVFMLELVAALQAVKILKKLNYDIRLTKMV
mmetsp:Transcript_12312/g.19400  ORF Transcript_12312/g.19400 Transcript_12312/m.19400 type:complete len:112 (-) Transcript_12312:300-635(-)